jgi:hypothetical protein
MAALHLAWCRARPVRLERTTCGFEVRRSIQLSYGRVGVSEGTRTPDRWGHNPVLYPTELHSPSKRSLQNGQLTQPHQISSRLEQLPLTLSLSPVGRGEGEGVAICIDKFVARLRGFEPPTHGLEVRSSIHLSYRRMINNKFEYRNSKSETLVRYSELRTRYFELLWSGRADLNGRPPAPKAGALTRLRYAPLLRNLVTKFQTSNNNHQSSTNSSTGNFTTRLAFFFAR